ncbi:unnamed protein product, partial [Linum tenue]
MTITPAAGRESTVNFVTSLVMSPRIASNSFPTNVRRRPTTPPIHLLLHLLRPTVAGSWTPQRHITSPTTSAISLSTLITTDRMKSTWVMVQDLRTGARLLTGRNKGDTYELPHQSAAVRVALVTTSHSPDSWHRRLGHPSSKSLLRLLRTQSLPHSSKSLTHCNSCLSNKSHKLPFGDSSLSSTRPFDLLFSDVWGPAPVESIDGYSYYLVIVDHFTRYTWIYPLKRKSDVLSVFIAFKTLIENFFSTTIRRLYTDGGGEFLKLKPALVQNGIAHLLTPPYTP